MTTDNAAKMIPGQLRDEPAQTREQYNFIINLAREANVRLTRDLVQARADLTSAKEAADVWFDKLMQARAELTQARSELKDLQGANRALARQLDDMRENREFWYERTQDAETKMEGLERRLAGTEAQIAATKEAVEWIWGFWDGNTLVARSSGYKEEIGAAWNKLLVASDAFSKSWESHGGNATKLLERLATLDAAEAALRTERQLRQEAQEYVDDCRIVLTGVRKTLDECQVKGKYDASAVIRIRWLAQRAERAEARAQLVTPELAALLEGLASYEDVHSRQARALAARIREALEADGD